MGDIILCSFASSNYADSLNRLKHQATRLGWFKRVDCLSEKGLAQSFVDSLKTTLSIETRGYGYWIWKPQVVLQELSVMNEGDILLYLDAGCHLNGKGYKLFKQYIDILNISSFDFLVFGSKKGTLERQYTKGDTLRYFGIENESSICDTGQMHATAFFVKKSTYSVEIIDQWKHIMIDNQSLIDDSASKTPNFPDFVENRHDQSIFSILMKLNSAKVLPVSHIWSYTWKYMNDYPIWAKRDLKGRNGLNQYSMNQYVKDYISYIKKKIRWQIDN